MAATKGKASVKLGQTLTLNELAKALSELHERYERSKWFSDYRDLLSRLPAKVVINRCLDKEDLLAIATWGGNQHGVKRKLARNTDEDVRDKTGEAIRYFHKPKWAIGALLDLEGLGLTYGSKTLMFMNPNEYCALDSNMKRGMARVLGNVRDGDRNSMIRGYVKCLGWCKRLQKAAKGPGPGPNGEWRLADVQSAVFQFCDEEGEIRT